MSFVTTPEGAEKVRAAAAAQGVPVSSVIDDLVQAGLRKRKTASNGTARAAISMKPVVDIPKLPAWRTRTEPDDPKSTIVTAADAPE